MSATEHQAPLALEFFAAPRPPAGDRGIALELGSLAITLIGLDDELAGMLLERFAPYASGADGADRATAIGLGREPCEYFLQPAQRTENTRVLAAWDPSGECVRYTSYRVAGWYDPRSGTGTVLLAGGDYEPALRALENFLRVAVAWRAAALGGALVHAASIVRDGRAYLFYGESGAGKSTLSACSRRGTVVSDDLSVVLPRDDGGLDLVGSPFRGTYTAGLPVVGRFPLAAGFRLIQAPRAAVREVPRVRALAELVGNLPFVADSFVERPDLFERTERSFATLSLAHLEFARDDSFWDAIDRRRP